MLSSLKKYIIAAAMLTTPFYSYASFEVFDWKADGDGLAVVNSATNNAWLNLSVTQKYSLGEVLNNLEDGGALEGWRVPNYSEIKTLFSSLYPELDPDSYYTFHNVGESHEGVFNHRLFGPSVAPYVYGTYFDDAGASHLFGVDMDRSTIWYDYSRRKNDRYDGVYLVANASPELLLNYSNVSANNVSMLGAGTTGAFAILIMGCASLKRKRKIKR